MLFENSKLKIENSAKGQLTIQLLIFGGIAVILLSGFLIWLDTITKTVIRGQDRAQALAIAEAGIEYYRWHIAHAPTDFQDGTTSTGPYTHPYYDKDGMMIGNFILDITPPPLGSSIVTIQSTGKIESDPSVQKMIKVKMGIPSFAQFAFVFNDSAHFGQGAQVFGPIMSNSGIRFDGTAYNLVSSALGTYNDPTHSGNNEFAAHTHVNPPPGSGINNNFIPAEAPPNPVPNRPDVFKAGRKLSVPAVDFTGITQDLAQMRADSLSNGFHASTSGAFGYDVLLKTNHTFDLYKVTALVTPSSSCTNVLGQSGWGTWSIKTEQFLSNNPIPTNGIIFLDDNAWARGQLNGSRVTIASAVFPDNQNTRTNITVNNSLTYTNLDGTDVLSLIAQKNIQIGMVSDTNLTIHGALMAQNGSFSRYYYSPPGVFNNGCSPYHTRNSLTTFGMVGSNKVGGVAYSNGTGYQTRNYTYDGNLLYNPPPSFPLTTDSYKTLLWDELQ